ncbi:zinc finger CCHC domain-containing protein 8 homolog [Plodia interpunctella]|uniref:zinc finger CCHC domain-containing protein 8 homolog n=1 Tax=Plodia interpunctella TaxID=58824 RepID=UPI002368C6A5|nr:zinc finger CCHC domain-containing protein 8 homolog [Plodia interpunctella]
MSKRKVGVNDIIYELDNDDIEMSSEDEVKDPKITRIDPKSPVQDSENLYNKDNSEEKITINHSEKSTEKNASPSLEQNGGKTSPTLISIDEKNINNGVDSQPIENNIDIDEKSNTDCTKTMIFNEDIVVDSPASNSDLGVVGCENRTPLVSVRFKDNKLAKGYKEKIKAFMLRLIKLHDEDSSDTETDLELDIWPEDLIEDDFNLIEEKEPEDNLFFIDTAPCDVPVEVPRYSQVSTLISNVPDQEPTPPPTLRRGPICFNCDGSHRLLDCPAPKNKARIAENRKNMTTRVGRYHVEDEQKYGHLIPGRISGQLRHALGLKRHELPLHIYRMRLLGYPPGWLEEARISHSGITMFDSSGTAIQDPEEEDGEVCEPGSKDKFDIKKILDFPGFNVKASSRYKEEAHLYKLPPMSEQDSKMAMLQQLAPNAMKAYKRKKLTFFPSAAARPRLEGQAEMDLDSGDENIEFPSNPPLPDEAPPQPPQPPPPPDSPPPLPNDNVITIDDDKTDLDNSGDDLVLIEQDISIVNVDDSVVGDAEKDVEVDTPNLDRSSPTLDDLEEKKRKLLSALEGDTTLVAHINLDESTDNIEKSNTVTKGAEDANVGKEFITELANDETPLNNSPAKISSCKSPAETKASDSDLESKTELRTGHVKTTAYGTPVMNVASSYVKLPSDDKFSKDICDVINFENLPNSTGKYKQISNLLKKVKSEVDRIQES